MIKNNGLLFVSLLLIGILSSCMPEKEQEATVPELRNAQIIYDLNDSTNIILALLKEGNLANILEDADSDKLDTLIKNVSPALMAFESEVLASTLPVLVCYYMGQKDQCKTWLMHLHEELPDIKYVLVDIDKLFSVAQQSDVESTPTLLFVQDREQRVRFVEPIDIEQIKEQLQLLLKTS